MTDWKSVELCLNVDSDENKVYILFCIVFSDDSHHSILFVFWSIKIRFYSFGFNNPGMDG